MNNKAINFILFQIGWFACVLGAANQMPLLGVFVAVFVVGFHLYAASDRIREALYIAVYVTLGYTIDSTLVAMGYFEYAGNVDALLAPLWIAALWALFSSTIGSSLSWLSSYRALASLLGAVFGPIAYYSASKLDAVQLMHDAEGLYFQAFVWAVVMPLMFASYDRLVNSSRQLQQENAL